MAKKPALRTCVGCGESKDKKELIRVIRTPEEEVCLDVTGRANGRGAYICHSVDCLKKVRKNKGLERSLKITIPDNVYDALEEDLKKFEQ